MSDEFLKTVEIVQTTGVAPDTSAQSSSSTVTTAKLVTESVGSTAKTLRFDLNESTNNSNGE